MIIAPLIALLVGRGVAGWLASLIVYGVLGLLSLAAIGAGIYWVNSEWNTRVAEPYRVEGDNRTKFELQPRIDDLKVQLIASNQKLQVCLDANAGLAKDIDGLKLEVKASADTIDRMKVLADRAREMTRKLLAQITERARRDADEIARLKAAAAGPPIVEKLSEKTAQVLSELAVWRRSQQ